ncbi:hypothetical protein GCM10023187_25060 [Nibrella viscosa]|uniref:Oligosaccharide repeat unit polymerase n=1 Tax=Nibrella viscosa TaxID=1084524 RepID=A0ABP8KGT8_9BACT
MLILEGLYSLSIFEEASVAISLLAFMVLIVNLSKRIVIMEIISAIACLQVLLTPVLIYQIAPSYMPIQSDDYFSYVLPATISLLAGLAYFSLISGKNHGHYFSDLKVYLNDKPDIGLWMVGLGIVTLFLEPFVPQVFKNILFLFKSLLYTGCLYIYFSKAKYKFVVLVFVIIYLFFQTVQAGMFGELVYWLMLFVIFMLAGNERKVYLPTKILFISLGLFLAILVQSIKLEYRLYAWRSVSVGGGGNASFMLTLISDRINNIDKLFQESFFLSALVRFNEGFYIGHTLAYVPSYAPFANGEILNDFVAPVIPRFIWTDKPLANGLANIKRFTSLTLFEGNNFDISPIGEAYGNFGYWGTLFLLLYGVLIGGVFYYILKKSENKPTLLLWLPKIFVSSLLMESNVFTAWGGTFQSFIFVALIFKVAEIFKYKI